MAAMRKTKLTREMVEAAIELRSCGLNDCDIIDALGVHQSTFYRWLKEGEDARPGTLKRALSEGLKKATVGYKRVLLTTVKDASGKPQYWTAAAWLLERKFPHEYGKMERKADDATDAPVQLVLDFTIEPMIEDGGEDGDGGDSGTEG